MRRKCHAHKKLHKFLGYLHDIFFAQISVFTFARLLMGVTFFSLGYLKQRKLLSLEWTKDSKQTWELQWIPLADTNTLLSFRYNPKLVYQNDVQKTIKTYLWKTEDHPWVLNHGDDVCPIPSLSLLHKIKSKLVWIYIKLLWILVHGALRDGKCVRLNKYY